MVIFFVMVAAVFLLAALAILRKALRTLGFFYLQTGSKIKAAEWFSIGLAAIGVMCFIYGFAYGPYDLEVRNVEVFSSKVSDTIRVVHISDIHSDPFPRLEEALPSIIKSQKPDLIVYSGDSVNSEDGLPVFRKFIKETATIAPTYVVRGNWDVWYWPHLDLFGDTGAIELNENSESFKKGSTEILLSGKPVESQDELPKLISSAGKDRFHIALYHYPDEIEPVSEAGADLYCAGHTHGGQVALPIYGALVTFSKYGKRYEGGTYNVRDTTLNVNRGIGMEGGTTPRVRFWATPEITVIDIKPK